MKFEGVIQIDGHDQEVEFNFYNIEEGNCIDESTVRSLGLCAFPEDLVITETVNAFDNGLFNLKNATDDEDDGMDYDEEPDFREYDEENQRVK